MNKKPLSQLLSEGWKIHIRGVVDIKDAPLPEDTIAEIMGKTNNSATHILFLSPQVSGQGTIYAITDDGELELARQEAEDDRCIIGYDLRITCGAKSLDGEIKIGSFAKNIGMVTGWDIQINDGEKDFDVLFHIEGDSKPQGYASIENIEEVLIALSAKNRMGFEIRNIAWGPRYAAQPFSIWAGRPESIPCQIDHDDIRRVRDLRMKGGDELLSKFARFYGQVTQGAKIIFGFALLEDLFDDRPDHILDKAEIDSILRKAAEIHSVAVSEVKQKKLRDVLSNSALMSKKTRNERIAAKISKLMGISEECAYSTIRKLSQLRAASAHSTKEEIEGLSEASAFIEEVLLRHLNS